MEARRLRCRRSRACEQKNGQNDVWVVSWVEMVPGETNLQFDGDAT